MILILVSISILFYKGYEIVITFYPKLVTSSFIYYHFDLIIKHI